MKDIHDESTWPVWANETIDIVEPKSGNILVVTHSVILKSLLMYVKGKSIKDLWAPPFIHDTSLTILEIKDGMHHLLSEGDVSHLNNVTSV